MMEQPDDNRPLRVAFCHPDLGLGGERINLKRFDQNFNLLVDVACNCSFCLQEQND